MVALGELEVGGRFEPDRAAGVAEMQRDQASIAEPESSQFLPAPEARGIRVRIGNGVYLIGCAFRLYFGMGTVRGVRTRPSRRRYRDAEGSSLDCRTSKQPVAPATQARGIRVQIGYGIYGISCVSRLYFGMIQIYADPLMQSVLMTDGNDAKLLLEISCHRK